MTNRQARIPSWLKESALIVFSVLLALIISEWRNNYNEKQHTKKLLENLKQEIHVNQVFLRDLVIYHEFVLENIQEAIDIDSLERTFYPNYIFRIGAVAPDGIVQDEFKTIAWLVAKEEKITNRIPFKNAEVLFGVYQQQETVNETVDRIIQLISGREVQRKLLIEESIIVFGTQINELLGQMKNLQNRYDEALEIFEN